RHVALATHPWAIVRHGCAVPNNPRGWAGGIPRPRGFGTAQPCRTPRKLKNVRRITAGRAGRPQFARERLPPFERVTFSACANLTLAGTVTGTQSLTVTTTFNWNGGTQSGGGTTTIPSGATTNVGGYGSLDGRTFSNAGTLNITSSYYFYLLNNAALTNSGTI